MQETLSSAMNVHDNPTAFLLSFSYETAVQTDLLRHRGYSSDNYKGRTSFNES
jgi:hypothetical protein